MNTMKALLYTCLTIVLLIVGCKKDKEEPQPQPAPLPQQGLLDVEGNDYDTVVIGGRTWMAENLRVRKYRNGDSIPYMPEAADWSLPGSNAYCMFGNAILDPVEHGLLYGYGAVNDARGICPTGWHVPTDAEWAQLERLWCGSRRRPERGWSTEGAYNMGCTKFRS